MSQKISDEELLKDLRRVTDELGESPTAVQYREEGSYSPNTFQNRFGSWNKAKEQAGLETSRDVQNREIEDDDLLRDLRTVADQIGESPSIKQYEEHGQYSSKTASNRFGSWNEAKEEAGLKQHSEGTQEKASIEEILEELREGKTLGEIREKFGYTNIQTVSSRLRRNGYTTRSRLSKNKAAYSGDRWAGILNISASLLDELGISSVEDAYYDMEPVDGEKAVKIKFSSERVKEVEEEDGGENHQ
ncbi:hypothetical protein SAMN05443574_103330 [Haloarcula vallismortis]|uniref:Uncharacterized protein n=2 Tax=Haloarcula vallismortis TaxID=28442 RepID=M0JRK2_HALVA|nr:hypothetical protein [Haloarcula vallismortis]EMA11591.1 hypothetical protein C437_01725 [Haloarcula vallismortis ATCC 29715]SDW45723.1 hypothetical protein SAMN05443574_103330 [Haloarcula vallismortis]